MKRFWQFLPWGLAGVLLLLLLAPASATAPTAEQAQKASASCTGLFVISSCNVHAEAQQQPAQPEKSRGKVDDLVLVLFLLIGTISVMLWSTRDGKF